MESIGSAFRSKWGSPFGMPAPIQRRTGFAENNSTGPAILALWLFNTPAEYYIVRTSGSAIVLGVNVSPPVYLTGDGASIGTATVAGAAPHYEAIYETATTDDTLDCTLVYGIVERLRAIDTLVGNTIQFAGVSDALNTRDSAVEQAEFIITDVVDSYDNIVATRAAIAALYDLVTTSEVLSSAYRGGVNIFDTVVATAAMAAVYDAQQTDAAGTTEMLEGYIAHYANLLDQVLAIDETAGMARLTVQLEDGAEPSDTLASASTVFATIDESVTATVAINIEGQAYTAVVMNATTRALSEYAPYDFNSLAWFNGRAYGANALGLFELSGDTDNAAPIEAYARTALARIANGRLAQVDSAYLGYSSDGTMQLKTIVTEPNGSKTSRVYQLNTQNADASRSGRIKLGRGVKSAYWAFEISNVLGSDFTIDVVEMHVLALSRRI